MPEDLEGMWRKMVLDELKELNEGQKKLTETLDKDVARKLQTLEHLVVGVDGKNGLRGKVEIIDKDVQSLKELRTKIVTAVVVAQTIIGGLLFILTKLGFFQQ